MTPAPIAKLIPVTKITPNPNKPRKVFDETSLRELAQSIAENDLLQPITVEDNLDGTYTLVGGERRWRAFQLLGRTDIPASVRARSNHGGRELLIHGIVENVQRENMNPVDEAEAYQRLHKEFGMSWIEIGLKLGKNSSVIGQRARILKLEPEIVEMIRTGKLTHLPELATALLRIPDPKARIKLAHKIADGGMTLRQAIAAANKVAAMLGAPPTDKGGAQSMAMHLVRSKHPTATFDEDTPPARWNALSETGQAPPWAQVTEAVTKSCQACPLADIANHETCGVCPLVEFLHRLVKRA